MTAAATPLRLYCSFCGKSQHEVAKLIAGVATVCICDECVDLCRDIVDEARASGPAPAFTPAQEASIRGIVRDEITAGASRDRMFMDDLVASARDRALPAFGLTYSGPARRAPAPKTGGRWLRAGALACVATLLIVRARRA